ncbi:MAG: hypothetical protein ABSC88_04265 [Terracidiphilus sp.]|jgi:hypothetical protein
MAAQGFAFEDCLLKHYVRVKGWLPHCKARKKANDDRKPSEQRRLRYFTFCAIGAIDVLMLNVAKIISLSQEDKFDTVVFFDREPDAVLETQKRIPGAIGFPGSFTDVVLANDPAANITEDYDYLAPPLELQDEYGTRREQIVRAQRRDFIKKFPFDIVNLDLEEFAFKPYDPFPGKVIRAMRKLFEWQRAPLYAWPGRPTKSVYLDGFTLMFTTQIGPPDISEEYTDMLRDYLEQNIACHPDLGDVLLHRTGAAEVATLQSDHFEDFFKLGVPKVLAGLLLEADWYVDDEKGISTYTFKRNWIGGEYTMLHFVMDVKRQTPPRERRAPNSGHVNEANEAYASVVSRLFNQGDIEVTNELASSTELKPSLADIRARRRMYYPDDV